MRFLAFGLMACSWLPSCGQDPSGDGSGAQEDALTEARKKHAVTVTPATVTLAPGGTQQFQAQVKGGGSVVWTASYGTIDATGLYTAPNQSATDTVTATVSGSTTHATAGVVVTAGGSSSGGACSSDGATLEAACVHAGGWGHSLNATFGRIDGHLVALAKPTDTQCDQSNSSHFVLEISMNGATYPLVVNVDDKKSSNSSVYFAETDAPLQGVPWQEGWHTDSSEKLDYAKHLNVHSDAFQPYPETALVGQIMCHLTIGQQVSVYALGWGVDGAHDIHRNTGGGGADGAIVLNAGSASPHYLMFRFSNQTF
jgi:hypothetical protein